MLEETLKNMKIGEVVVEMQECDLHNRIVIEVSTYTKKRNIFGILKINKYTYPFYFNSKELAENFLKYSSYFNIIRNKFDYLYLQLKNNKHNCVYCMIDDFKLKTQSRISLEINGIWAGDVNPFNRLYLNPRDNINFMEIFNNANIGLKNEKRYIFKMITE